jgi:hypothetical protein
MTLNPDVATRLLARADFDAPELAKRHPPKFTDGNKKLIHRIACPTPPQGRVEVSRWAAEKLPDVVPDTAVVFEVKAGIYDYPKPDPGTVAWHLNFADAHLFYAYGSGLFAQDEMQVAEHPILASLRESLVAEPIEGLRPITTEFEATPVLVMGAERSCAIDPGGARSIYGNAMHRASEDTIRERVQRLNPPTTTNVLAIEALPGGGGRYGPDEISRVAMTATAGFSAARLESKRVGGPEAKVVIHTGHWGCGAYGGNKILMALLQLLGARLAQIDCLVFHAFDEPGQAAYGQALNHYEELVTAGTPVKDVLWKIDDLGFRWGSSDGN